MPATLEAPPSGVTIIDSGPPKPPPAPSGEIRVSQMTPPPSGPGTDPGPITPLKPGSAKKSLRDALLKKAGVNEDGSPSAPDPKPKQSPAEPGKASAGSSESPSSEAAPTPPADAASSGTQPAPASATDSKTGKTNPWKLVDEWKGRASTLEKEVVELKKQLVPEQERKSIESRVAAAEARAKEMEDEIRYVNYQKHPDYIKNYQEPYEKAWKAATTELSEITITDPSTREARVATPQDLMELVGLPLGKAREIADQVFGPFADDVMAHRKVIKSLFENRTAALEEAKKSGAAREQQMRERMERQNSEVQRFIKTTWEKVNASALEDPKNGHYFKPREGDQEWNQRLGKGFQLVDQAYSETPEDPRLTPEQRSNVIKRHAAVRNRAASWGALKFENGKLSARLKEVEAELSQYKSSTPPTGGSSGQPANGQPSSAREQVFAALRAKAK